MCSQVSCVNVTYVPAWAAFNPAIRAVIFNPLPFSSPISTPHTSLLLFERACCRIWRRTSPSIVTRGCCSDLRFPMSNSARQLSSKDSDFVATYQICLFCVFCPHGEDVIQRQPELIEIAPTQTLVSRIIVNRLHHAHLAVRRTASLLIPDTADRLKSLFAHPALRALQLVYNI